MSLEMQTFVPDIKDAVIPLWIERMNGLGMHCEIDPSFSFNTDSGFLPFRVALEKPAHKEMIGNEYLTGFEFYMSDFNLADEIDAITPKPGFLERITRKKQQPVFFASPEIDRTLAHCTKMLSFIWGSADTLQLRMATLSSVVLAAIAGGVSRYYDDDIWYVSDEAIEEALKEAEEYEVSLRPGELKLYKFAAW